MLNNSMWTVWNTNGNNITQTSRSFLGTHTIEELTPPQREAQRLAAIEQTQRIEEANRKREAAEKRAEQLLLENLNLQQRLDYEKSKSFFVTGRSGRRFRVRHGRSGNVDVINRQGVVEHRLCAHPAMLVPNPDTMLAQKLLLEENDDAFVRVANRHPAFRHNEQVAPALLQ